MNWHYEKEPQHNFLVPECKAEDADDYVCQMICRGSLPQLLPLFVSTRNGVNSLRYDVTACVSLASRYKSEELSGKEVRRILRAILDTAQKLTEFLLDPRDLCLDPDFLFYGPGADRILLCCIPHLSSSAVPGSENGEPDSIRILADYFIRRISHQDTEAVDLAYALFDKVSLENYLLQDTLKTLLTPPEESVSGYSFGTGPAARPDIPNAAPACPSAGAAPVSSHTGGCTDSRTGSRTRAHCPGTSAVTPDRAAEVSGNISSMSRAEQDEPDFEAFRPAWKNSRKKSPLIKTLLFPAVAVCAAAAAVVILFHPDLTQLGGIGFLSAAVIWMIHNALAKYSGDVQNVWADEDAENPDDESFYQSLLKEAYNPPNPLPHGRRASDAAVRHMEASAIRPGNPLSDDMHACSEERTRYLGTADNQYVQKGALSLLSLSPEHYPDLCIEKNHVLIGKSTARADVVLSDRAVSRVHARIERRSDGYYVTDLFSTNGTVLDGHPLEPNRATLLCDGACLSFASSCYRIKLPC